MIFKNLGYVEFILPHNDDKIYVDRFTSDKTETVSFNPHEKFIQVFENIDKTSFFSDLYSFIDSLNSIQGNFFDFFWFMPVAEKYRAEFIFDWMSSLVLNTEESCLTTPLHTSFRMNVFVKKTSLPGQAIDAPPIFRTSSQQKFVALGYKNKPPPFSVEFLYATIPVGGLSGYIILGEHLERSEVARMDELYEAFKQLPESQKYIELNTHNASPAYRTLMEEGGFKIVNSKALYVGKDDTPGRDARYWTFQDFGYERISQSHMVCVIVDGDPPENMPDPEDTFECSKCVILSEEVILKEFRVGGLYPPAFPAHVNQLKHCLSMM